MNKENNQQLRTLIGIVYKITNLILNLYMDKSNPLRPKIFHNIDN